MGRDIPGKKIGVYSLNLALPKVFTAFPVSIEVPLVINMKQKDIKWFRLDETLKYIAMNVIHFINQVSLYFLIH